MTKKNQRNRLEKLNRRIIDAKYGNQEQTKKNKKPKTMSYKNENGPLKLKMDAVS